MSLLAAQDFEFGRYADTLLNVALAVGSPDSDYFDFFLLISTNPNGVYAVFYGCFDRFHH